MERDLHEHSFLVDDILIHPDYRKGKINDKLFFCIKTQQSSYPDGLYSNDIGIVKVKGNSQFGIGFNTHVRAICIPSLGDTPPPGASCTVTGWGVQKGNYLYI